MMYNHIVIQVIIWFRISANDCKGKFICDVVSDGQICMPLCIDKDRVCDETRNCSIYGADDEANCDRLRPCGDDWVSYNNLCYLFGTTDVSFDDALDYCESLDSNLVSIRNSDESDFIKYHLRQLSADKFWIGMTDEDVEDTWVWIDTGEEVTFFDWGNLQPNQGTASNCGAIWESFDHKFVDEPCTGKMFRPICKK